MSHVAGGNFALPRIHEKIQTGYSSKRTRIIRAQQKYTVRKRKLNVLCAVYLSTDDEKIKTYSAAKRKENR